MFNLLPVNYEMREKCVIRYGFNSEFIGNYVNLIKSHRTDCATESSVRNIVTEVAGR